MEVATLKKIVGHDEFHGSFYCGEWEVRREDDAVEPCADGLDGGGGATDIAPVVLRADDVAEGQGGDDPTQRLRRGLGLGGLARDVR